MVTLTANVSGEDLGRISSELDSAIKRAGELPRGVKVTVRGQIGPMKQTLTNLGMGLLLACWYLSAACGELSIVEAGVRRPFGGTRVICGCCSCSCSRYESERSVVHGAIMAIGVAVANAILLVTFAEEYRRAGNAAMDAALHGAKTRLRPILMTSMAMIAAWCRWRSPSAKEASKRLLLVAL